VLHVIDERKIEAIALYGTGGSYVFIDKMREEAKRELIHTRIGGHNKPSIFL